jgi:hypothetical protein
MEVLRGSLPSSLDFNLKIKFLSGTMVDCAGLLTSVSGKARPHCQSGRVSVKIEHGLAQLGCWTASS